MISAVQISGTQRAATAVPVAHVSDKAIGILLASVVPALFWTATIALVGSAIGQSPSIATLVTTGAAISAFLAIVVGSLVVRGD